MYIQGWFLLGFTGFISLLFKGLSRVFFSTTVWRHLFFGDRPPKGPPLTSIHAATAMWLKSCLTECDPIDGSLPSSAVPVILQARTLEWVAISFSNAWKWKVKVKSLGRVQLLATTWTAAYQAPPFMGFSGQEYWSGASLSSPYIQDNWEKPYL